MIEVDEKLLDSVVAEAIRRIGEDENNDLLRGAVRAQVYEHLANPPVTRRIIFPDFTPQKTPQRVDPQRRAEIIAYVLYEAAFDTWPFNDGYLPPE